ncbi:hypothetical protein A9Q99_16530 [Gammaproteobacteria bacterium 45_16_T64]|nr:hypothetical protein A9Q99_16530 [Gammaproteobacteria bacterium 45_16_T64]
MIDPFSIGLMIIVFMLIAVIMSIPIPIAVISASVVGLTLIEGFDFAGAQMYMVIWEVGSSYLILNLPLFLFMGQLAYRSGIAADLFNVMYHWLGRFPGGVNLATVYTATGFGALTGSSLATVSTIGQVAMPEVKRYNYNEGFSAGCIASASVIAILIPPSLPMVIYGLWSETSIGSLFMAGIIPGLILSIAFSVYIAIRCWIQPTLGPPAPPIPFREKIRVLPKLIPTLCIIGIVFGGIYAGLFSPTEASVIGSSSLLLLALIMGRLRWAWVSESLLETSRLSLSIFMIFVGGVLLSRFLVQVEFTEALVDIVNHLFTSPTTFLLALMVVYIFLGAILDSYGMIVLTLPFVLPSVQSLGIDMITFGIFLTLMIEISLITPPIGLNAFMMQKITPNLPLWSIFEGCIPFVIISIITVLFIVAFPEVVLFLPNLMPS